MTHIFYLIIFALCSRKITIVFWCLQFLQNLLSIWFVSLNDNLIQTQARSRHQEVLVSWIWPIKPNLSETSLKSVRWCNWLAKHQGNYYHTWVLVSLNYKSAVIYISFSKESEVFRLSQTGEDRGRRWWPCVQSFEKKFFCRWILLEHSRHTSSCDQSHARLISSNESNISCKSKELFLFFVFL